MLTLHHLAPGLCQQPGWYPGLQSSCGNGSSRQPGNSQNSKYRLKCTKQHCGSNRVGVRSQAAVSGLCLQKAGEGKMHKKHLPLLQVIYWTRTQATHEGNQRVCYLLVTERERLTFCQCPYSFTALSSSSYLFFSLPWPVPACANSVLCSKSSVCKVLKAECPWPVDLNSSLTLPTDGSFPRSGK